MSKEQTILYDVLSLYNIHERDKYINFYEPTHTYSISIPSAPSTENPYTSVTTWVHSHFPHFDADKVITKMMKGKNWNDKNKYWGLLPEQIKEMWNQNSNKVSSSGTDMHYEIECFMNQPNLPMGYTHKELLEYYENTPTTIINDTTEWKFFLQYLKDTPDLKPYRTEWTIFNEDLKIAGSVDMIYENPDGTLSIYDWKRVKDIKRMNSFNEYAITFEISHFHHTNFWHYAMQLNTYQAILEAKYNKKVKDLYLVQIHPEHEDNTYELIKLPNLQKSIQELFKERLLQFNNKKTV